MPGPITVCHMVKHVVVYENILVGFSVGHCEFKVNVTLALAKFPHFIGQITSRWLFIADSGKSYKRHQLYISYSQVCCSKQSSNC